MRSDETTTATRPRHVLLAAAAGLLALCCSALLAVPAAHATTVFIPTTTTLSVLPTTVPLGTPVTVTATVEPTMIPSPPLTGAVSITETYAADGTSATQVIPVVAGRASLTFTPATLGGLSIVAAYLGDTTHDDSLSDTVSTTVVRVIPGLAVSPSRLLFSDVVVGSTATQTLTLTNTGTVPWSSGGAASSDPAVTLDTSPCTSLAPGDSCSITVAYAPTSAGPFNSAISFSVGTFTVALGVSGNAVARTSALSPTPSPVAFGEVRVGSAALRTVTLTNTGNATWSTTGSGAETGLFHLDATACDTVVPGASCTATVTFAPTTTGTVSTTLSLLGATGTATIPVTGTGILAKPAAAKPVVTRISPNHGPRRGGTLVTIAGRNFTAVTAIRIGGVAMSSVRCSSSTTCTAITPRGTGTKAIRVVTAAGTSALVRADRYTYR